MIVTCERCATQFQLDDSRVPEDGVRVRCSRCKHAFRVEPPARNELDRIHRVARRALAEAEEGPDVTQDLAPSSAVASNQEFLPDDEESDWEFNEGVPGARPEQGSDALSAAESAVDALLGGRVARAAPSESVAPSLGGEDEDEGLELGAASGLEAPDSDPLAARPASSASPGPTIEQVPPALESETAAAESATSASGVPPAEPLVPSEAPAEIGSDELGSPSDWDIFEERPPAAKAEQPAAAPPTFVRERRAAPLSEVQEPDDGVGVWLFRAAAGLGWTLTAALCAAGLGLGLAQRAPASSSSALVEIGGLAIEQVTTRWVDNASRGPLLLVSGRIHPRGAPARPGDALFLVLRDGSGRPVGERAPVGPLLDARLLRESDLAAIREAQSGLGAPLDPALVPAAGMSFAAVVWPVPERAARFDFTVAESEASSSGEGAPLAAVAPAVADPLPAAAEGEDAPTAP